MRFDFFDLQLFLYIAQTGSLTKAAACSAISLQAASERIKKLEQYFKVILLERHASGVELTQAGYTFLAHAEKILQQSTLLKEDMQYFAKNNKEILTLWCNSSAQSEYLPALLPQFLLQHQHLQIELHEAESHEIVAELESGKAYLGIISSFLYRPTLQHRFFVLDPLVLICAPSHQIADLVQVELKTVVKFDFVGLFTQHSLQQSIDAQMKLLQAKIHYRLRLANFEAIAQVVAEGVGIAIIPKHAAQRLLAKYAFTIIALLGEWANRQLLVACRDFAQLPLRYAQFAEFLLQHNIDAMG